MLPHTKPILLQYNYYSNYKWLPSNSIVKFGSKFSCFAERLLKQQLPQQETEVEERLRLRHENKLTEVRSMFHETKNQLDSMLMIDSLQKLGIDYHFNEEIEADMESLYAKRFDIIDGNNFVEITLLFRLLRQARYPMSSNVFCRFTTTRDGKGEFLTSLTENISGMLNLFEASYLNTGEAILRKANEFTSEHLKSSMAHLDPKFARFIRQALENPYHTNLQTYKARQYLISHQQQSLEEEDEGKKRVIRELARMDFVLNQSLHRNELKKVKRWCENLGFLARELRFARNQSLKWYIWSMTALPNPKFSDYRIALTKVIAFVYLLDDIFDVRGSPDELHLLTEAINKWELSAIYSLPSYMRTCYTALYNTANEIAETVMKEHGWNPIHTIKKSWATLSNAFLVEAKWFANDHVPAVDDYMRNAMISCGVPLVLVHLHFLLGGGGLMDDDTVNLVETFPKLISCPATILRLWDDLGSAEDESQDGTDGSYLECFMKENPHCSAQGARERVMQLISEEWEELNRESFSSSSFSQDFIAACLNTARMVKLVYSYDDEHKLPMLEEYINLLLVKDI